MDQNNNFQPQQAPQQPYYQQPQMPPQKNGGNVLGIIALIIGIISTVFCWTGCACVGCAINNLSNPTGAASFGWIFTLIAAVGVVLAILAMKSDKNGLAVVALVICIIGLVFSLIGSAIASCACYGVTSAANRLYNAFSGYGF